MEIMCHVMHISFEILRQIRTVPLERRRLLGVQKRRENEKQSLKPTPHWVMK